MAGLTLEESSFRSKTGATIAMIDRGKRRILAPKRGDRLFPGDRLYLVGTDEQLDSAQRFLAEENKDTPPGSIGLFGLEPVQVRMDSPYVGQSILSCGIGEKLSGLIMGIERDGQRILNPDSSTTLLGGDLLWVFGNREEISRLRKNEA
jgi:CPA2 family monovalent cation:H+ antiporter-2